MFTESESLEQAGKNRIFCPCWTSQGSIKSELIILEELCTGQQAGPCQKINSGGEWRKSPSPSESGAELTQVVGGELRRPSHPRLVAENKGNDDSTGRIQTHQPLQFLVTKRMQRDGVGGIIGSDRKRKKCLADPGVSVVIISSPSFHKVKALVSNFRFSFLLEWLGPLLNGSCFRNAAPMHPGFPTYKKMPREADS